jgi:glycosyltransferase involved in cell wall biosynthesis
MLRVSVIVPAHNAATTLPRTLEALASQDLSEEFEVIVVDDGSTDATAEAAGSAAGWATVLRQPRSGPAAARNLGARSSAAPLLDFCDADVFPTPGWLRAGVMALERAEIVQGKVRPEPGADLGAFDRSLWVDGRRMLWETANLFVGRELFERVGGFEEWIVPGLGGAIAEDVWFGYRALRLGATGAFCEEALAHHAVFRRGWRAYVAERRRLRYFPAIAGKMPEVRRDFLYRRVFLNSRTARFDVGLAGSLAALLVGSPLPLLALAPYVSALRSHSRRARTDDAHFDTVVAAADLAGDFVGLAALVAGSVRYRSPVL